MESIPSTSTEQPSHQNTSQSNTSDVQAASPPEGMNKIG